jgi:hypothetical protein
MPVTYYPDDSPHSLPEERKWSHLLKLPGVKSGMQIPVSCRLQNCQHQLVTPRRVRVSVEIDLSTQEVQLAQNDGPKVRWKVNPEVIPAASAVVSINHIIHIPKDQPAILRIEGFLANARIEQITTMRGRLVVKGTLLMQTKYKKRS